jgi:hypothetical protein
MVDYDYDDDDGGDNYEKENYNDEYEGDDGYDEGPGMNRQGFCSGFLTVRGRVSNTTV